MTKIWNNIKKILNKPETIKFLILLLFLVICIVLFIVIQNQDNSMNNVVKKNKETFTTTSKNITIKVDDIDLTMYDESYKLKLLNGNNEFDFTLENLENKKVSKINFINTPGNYQNVELTFDDTGEDTLKFSQFLNLDTAYKMVVYYSANNENKTISHTFQTSMELNYTPSPGSEIDNSLVDLKITNSNNSLDSGVDMQQFNYVTFNIEKPNLNSLRVKLLETEFIDDNARNEYLKKLQQFDKLVPLKFDANLSLIKNIGDDETQQYINYSEMDLREHRKKFPIPERIILPNPNCNSNNCELQIRNVVNDQLYILKIRLEYYYLDNIRNIRATPYLVHTFKVNDNDQNSFSISKLNIVGKLEETKELAKLFEGTQEAQNINLDNIEKNFNNMLN